MQLEDIPRVAPPVLAVYGQNSESEALADELVLDGYDVRLIGDLAQLGEVDLIVFARTAIPPASLREPSCCAASGATRRRMRRARWTRTPPGCVASSPKPVQADGCLRLGASAIASRLPHDN
jgi:hypothetical protein